MSGAMLFPSRRLRATPFTECLSKHGVQGYTVYNHMLLPTVFAGLREDYAHLKRHVQIWDVSAERQVQIKGRDAHKLACLVSARDLRNAQIGRCYYTPICDQYGKMINDPVVLRIDEDVFWFSIADSDLLLWIQGIALGMGLDVDICEPDISPLAIQGPKSEELLVDLFGEDIRTIKFFHFKPFAFKGRMLNIARSGWSKQGGFEIYLDDSTLGSDLWNAIWAKGAPYDLRPGCPNLIERIESGLFSYGNDMNRENTPLEVGLERFCSLNADNDYIGKSALLEQRAKGVEKRLVGIVISGDQLDPVTIPLMLDHDGKKIGMVTSGVYSPDLKENIGFAIIECPYDQSGVKLNVHTSKGICTGILCEISDFYARLRK